MNTVILTKWRFESRKVRQAIEVQLTGHVFEHPRFGAGAGVRSSRIVEEIERGRLFRTISGTIYQLEPPCPFPAAYALVSRGLAPCFR